MSASFDRNVPRARELLGQALAAERLDLAALAIVALEVPDVDTAQVERVLEGLAERVRLRTADGAEALTALRHVLGEEEGFGGDHAQYADAASSFIDAVLRTKRGLPIALSVIYVEVARRAGIPLYGVAFPGQFLVGCGTGEEQRILDPFGEGRTLSPADCETLLRRFAPQMKLSAAMLAPANVSAITARMLTNLKQFYLRQGQGEKALRVMDLLLVLAPDHPGELRARAALLSALGAYRAALADVERCLKLAPEAQDARNLTQAAKSLKQRLEYLN